MESLKEWLQEVWSKPGIRKLMIAIPLVVVLYFIMSGMKERKASVSERAAQRTEIVEQISVFGNAGMADLDKYEVDAMREEMQQESAETNRLLANERKTMREESKELSDQLAEAQKDIAEMKKFYKSLERNGMPMNNQGNGNGNGNNNQQQVVEGNSLNVIPQQSNQGQDQAVVTKQQTTILTRSAPIEGRAIRRVTQRQIRSIDSAGGVKLEQNPNAVMTQHNEDVSKGNSVRKKEQETLLAREFFLPAGSIMSGTLINGVDAPTSSAATDEPMPILLRIKKEAILPNHYSMDVRECHMLASAVGKLSSERVMMRAEAISCVLNDGRAIEKNITAYAVSSYDGKVGVRGRLVSRNGSAIARAMMAGFVSGISDAATPNKILSIDQQPGNASLFQKANPTDILGAGAFKGASNAMDRLASYYTEMAENMYPIIELSAGIPVDFIVQKGMSFKLQAEN
jgi:conjugal transfer pilus assembly protein TraB